MSKERQIEEIIDVITCVEDNGYAYDSEGFEITGYANSTKIAEALYNADYRKQSEVIDEFVKRLLDAFPEGNRDNRCPAIYYDDYRYIIEELAEKMKGGAE